MKKIVVILFCIILFLASCGGNTDWKRVEFEFFSMVVPPGFEVSSQTDWAVNINGETGAIQSKWQFDQFSRNNSPARESAKLSAGDEILESTKAKLGDRHIWWNKTKNDGIITVRMTIPLEKGYLRLKGSSNIEFTGDIEKSIRSVVITNENYFIDSGD